jgi:flavin reductase (DIM6/NTAB) family NADH-FMN oxidoreductase RutF
MALATKIQEIPVTQPAVERSDQMNVPAGKHEVIRVMDQMPYGLYIVGSGSGNEVNGMMADWVMQVSFNPRLVAVAFENDAHTLATLQSHPFFTINFLSQDGEGMHLAGKFAQPYLGSKVGGRDVEAARRVHHKLEAIPYRHMQRGCPVLEKALAWLECEVSTFTPVGDHTLVIAEVLDGAIVREGEPLTSAYTGWTYSG